MITSIEQIENIDKEYLTFYIGQELVAIKLNFVEMIEFVPEIIPIPRAPAYVMGVVKIGNSIIPLISLDVLLKTKKSQEVQNPIAIIVSIDNAVFGIFVSQPPKVTRSDQKLSISSYHSKIIPDGWIIGNMEENGLQFVVLDPNAFWIGLGESEIIVSSSVTKPKTKSMISKETDKISKESNDEKSVTKKYQTKKKKKKLDKQSKKVNSGENIVNEEVSVEMKHDVDVDKEIDSNDKKSDKNLDMKIDVELDEKNEVKKVSKKRGKKRKRKNAEDASLGDNI